jgi:hypothetical protein
LILNAKYIEDKVHKLRIKNKIKFWYADKHSLKKTLYRLHIQNGKKWKHLWDLINQYITNNLTMETNIKYRSIKYNIRKLKEHKTQTQTTDKWINHIFYKRTENLTNVLFTDIEMQLLNKGLKYKLHH